MGLGYVPVARGLSHLLVVMSILQRSLNVVEVDVQPPNTHIDRLRSSYTLQWLEKGKMD